MSPRKRRSFSEEQKADAVRLVRVSGESLSKIARELDLTENSLRNWVRQADIDEGKGLLRCLPTDTDRCIEVGTDVPLGFLDRLFERGLGWQPADRCLWPGGWTAGVRATCMGWRSLHASGYGRPGWRDGVPRSVPGDPLCSERRNAGTQCQGTCNENPLMVPMGKQRSRRCPGCSGAKWT